MITENARTGRRENDVWRRVTWCPTQGLSDYLNIRVSFSCMVWTQVVQHQKLPDTADVVGLYLEQ